MPSLLLSHLVGKFDNGRFQPLSLSGYQLIVLWYECGKVVIFRGKALPCARKLKEGLIGFILYFHTWAAEKKGWEPQVSPDGVNLNCLNTRSQCLNMMYQLNWGLNPEPGLINIAHLKVKFLL